MADFVQSCNLLIAFDMLILDTKEVNRINIGIDKVGAKFTLMFAFQEISCQTLAYYFNYTFFFVFFVCFFFYISQDPVV